MNIEKIPNEFIFRFSKKLLVAPMTNNSIGIYIFKNQNILVEFGDNIYTNQELGWIMAMIVYKDELYVGGYYTDSGTRKRYVAKYNPDTNSRV